MATSMGVISRSVFWDLRSLVNDKATVIIKKLKRE